MVLCNLCVPCNFSRSKNILLLCRRNLSTQIIRWRWLKLFSRGIRTKRENRLQQQIHYTSTYSVFFWQISWPLSFPHIVCLLGGGISLIKEASGWNMMLRCGLTHVNTQRNQSARPHRVLEAQTLRQRLQMYGRTEQSVGTPRLLKTFSDCPQQGHHFHARTHTHTNTHTHVRAHTR